MSDGMVFDLSVTEIPVKIGDVEYTLKEASGDASIKYRNMVMGRVKMLDGKPSQMDNLADSEPFLVHLCLFDSEGKNVPINIIRSWPARIQKSLFEKAKEISQLDEEDEDDETSKNG